MAGILDKDFKTTVIRMVKELKEDIRKVKKVINEQNGNRTLKVNRILEMRSTITEMKNSLAKFQKQI